MRYAAFVIAILACFALSLTGASENNSGWPKNGELPPKDLVLYSPFPVYSYEARHRGLVGSGVVVLEIDKRTGYVTSARMRPSTGHKMLDDAALSAFRQWRFKPGAICKIKIPTQYTMRGFGF